MFQLRMAPVIPLTYPKSEKMNFLPPYPIFLRTKDQEGSYDGNSDSP